MGRARVLKVSKNLKEDKNSIPMKGIFGLFTYFSQLDRDGSGYLEKDEIEYLAEMFFGQGDKTKINKYVNEVFDKFDYDHSGELSYEEARDFIKDVYQFIDDCGGISDEQREKFLEVMDCDDAPADIKDQEKKQLNEYKDEKIARRGSIMPGDDDDEFDATKAKRGPNGEILGPDGKPLQRDADGYLIGPNGERLGPNGERLGLRGELLGPDGKPLVGPNGEMLLAPDGRPAVGPNGELLGPDGKPLLGPNGELLGPDGKPLLGPDGKPMGADGKPLLGPDGKPLIIGEDEIVAGSAAEAGSAMADFNFDIDPEEMARRKAEQEARRKALMAGMKDKKKRFEVRAYENDGWCKILQIWRPKATVDANFVKEKVKSKWFRDPNTDQWISRDRVENPRPKEEAPAGMMPEANAAA